MLVEEVSWSKDPGFLGRCIARWTSNSKALGSCVKGKAIGWGREYWSQGWVLLGDSQLHPHQEDSVGGGEGSGLFLIVTPFISFALSASV